jgi:hypothetical protein
VKSQGASVTFLFSQGDEFIFDGKAYRLYGASRDGTLWFTSVANGEPFRAPAERR